MEITQYDVLLICLDPTVGKEMQKTRPCLILSPIEMNENLGTVIVAPMTTKEHKWLPMRVKTTFLGKKCWVALDQIKTIDKTRIAKYLGALEQRSVPKIKQVLQEMLID